MNIFSVDTSTEAMHLCLAMGDEDTPLASFESRTFNCGWQHSEHLVVQMLEMCHQNNLEFKDLQLLVCSRGPGSFTGLRIGMSALKGIALAGNIPLVSIPTMEAISTAVGFFDGPIIPVIDAKKQRYYSAIFLRGQRLSPDMDCEGQEIVRLLEGEPQALVTGPDSASFAPLLSSYRGRLFVDPLRYRDISQTLVTLGVSSYKANGPDDIGIGPVYVRKSDAEIALQQKIKKMEEPHGCV